MQISKINFINNSNYLTQNQIKNNNGVDFVINKNNFSLSFLPQKIDIVHFDGNKSTYFNYEKFNSDIKKHHENKNISDILLKSIQNSENFLGKGKEGVVYKIDKIKNYVVKVPKEFSGTIKNDFVKTKDYFPHDNFGQVIARNSQNIQILKKVEGYPHGLSMDKLIKQNFKVLPEDSHKFLEQLKTIEKFPLNSYIDLANKMKTLNKCSIFCVDMINPNNLLIDTKEKKFNIIDLFNKNEKPNYENYSADVNTMINLILFSHKHNEIYESLTNESKQELKAVSRSIINKCKIAANKVSLPLSAMNSRDYFDNIMNFVRFRKNKKHEGLTWGERYDSFFALYSDLIPELPQEKKCFDQTEFYKNLIIRLNQQDKIADSYLSYLLMIKKLKPENITEIAKSMPEKLSNSDFDYFAKNKIPLTDYDDELILETRKNNSYISQLTENDEEYIEIKDNILRNEKDKIDKIPYNKKMVIITGLPATGKSTLINEIYSKNHYVADIDTIKTYFPSYEQRKTDNSLHNIARTLLQQQLIPYAVNNGTNIVIPTTGYVEYINRLAEPAQKNGYEVEIIHIKKSQKESTNAAIMRFRNEKRFVDPFFIAIRAKFLDKQVSDLKKSDLVDKISIINI